MAAEKGDTPVQRAVRRSIMGSLGAGGRSSGASAAPAPGWYSAQRTSIQVAAGGRGGAEGILVRRAPRRGGGSSSSARGWRFLQIRGICARGRRAAQGSAGGG